MICRRCGSEMDDDASVCERCGTRAGALPQPAPAQSNPEGGDATGGVIPYKNPPALIAYYLGLFSPIFPPLGIVAVILGVIGLRKRKQNPVIKGSVHAWIGIGCGGLTLVVGVVVFILLMIALMKESGG